MGAHVPAETHIGSSGVDGEHCWVDGEGGIGFWGKQGGGGVGEGRGGKEELRVVTKHQQS